MEDKNQNYEFNDNQNTIIRELAAAMNFIGVATIVLGIFTALGGMIKMGEPRGAGDGIAALIQAVLYVVIGVMTQGAAGYFAQVVKTEGNDISLLMQALDKLRAMYVLQKTLFIIAFVLLVLAFLMLMSR